MRTHHQIIADAGGPSALARALSLDPVAGVNLIKGWKRTDSIPAPYWAAVSGLALATLEELAEAAAARRQNHDEAA